VSASAPRILQSADEAPCGSLIAPLSDLANVILRWPSGEGFIMVEATHRAWCPSDGWEWSACEDHDFPAHLIAEGLTEAECRHLSGLSATDALAWCEARDKAATAKRPQPGDVVPWAEVEDGCLYHGGGQFRMVVGGQTGGMFGPDDADIGDMLSGKYPGTHAEEVATWYGIDNHAALVARDLGTDPEAWRKAMREWTAAGNRPAPKPAAPLAAAVADIEATAEVSESAAWAKVKAVLAEREDAFVRRGYMLDNLRASLAAAHKERDEARNARDSCYARREEAARITQTYVADALDGQRKAKDETLVTIKERDEARAGWAEQTADAARLRIALQEAQRRLVQAHEDIDTLIAKQTATDRELLKVRQDEVQAVEGRIAAVWEIESLRKQWMASDNRWVADFVRVRQDAQHRARIVGRLLDEMARGYFADRFLDPTLYADAMKAAGREVKP